MTIDPATGLLDDARFIASPNCDSRPAGSSPEVLVIHAISLPPGDFGGPAIEQFFCNRLDSGGHPYYRELSGLEVSSHFLIRRDGEIIQFVPVHLRAWHAGPSCCEGRTRVNDFSIGIELEGTDEMPFEEAQYRSLSVLTRTLIRRFPAITRARIYGHSDVAPERKTDPGPYFDWQRYRTLIA